MIVNLKSLFAILKPITSVVSVNEIDFKIIKKLAPFSRGRINEVTAVQCDQMARLFLQ